MQHDSQQNQPGSLNTEGEHHACAQPTEHAIEGDDRGALLVSEIIAPRTPKFRMAGILGFGRSRAADAGSDNRDQQVECAKRCQRERRC